MSTYVTHTASRSAIVAEVAKAIHSHCVAVRRKQHPTMKPQRFESLSLNEQDVYYGMANAALAVMQGNAMVYGRPRLTRMERLAAWFKRNVVDRRGRVSRPEVRSPAR